MAETSIQVPIGSNITNAPLNLGAYVSNIIGAALTLAAVASFIYLLWGGINWITAGGDTKKIEAAKDRITGALVGLAIVAATWAIFLVIDNFLGLGIAGGKSASIGAPGKGPSQQGVCIASSRCADGAVGSNLYCQNPKYTAKSFGSCGTDMVYCDCVVKP